MWLELARSSGGPVLELGCGPGRILFHLAKAGFEVVGLDHDGAMLSRARLQLTPALERKVSLQHADLRNFSSGRKFALAILACNTFAMLSDEDARLALGAVRRHLEPNGRLALDLPNPPGAVETRASEASEPLSVYTDSETGHPIQVYADQRLDSDRRKLEVTWIYDELFPDGQVHRLEFPVTYYLRSKESMCRLVKGSHFSHLCFYGDYNFAPLEPDSERMLLVARAD